MRLAERKRFNVMDLRCLKNMCGLTRIDHMEDWKKRRKTGVVRDLPVIAEQGVLQ